MILKFATLLFSLLLFFTACPAWSAPQAYVGVRGGIGDAIHDKIKNNLGNALELEHSKIELFSLLAGMPYDKGFLELEYLYLRNDLEKASNATVNNQASGEKSVHGIAVNTVTEFGLEYNLVGYVGLGAGIGLIDIADVTINGRNFANEDALALLLQGMFGLKFPITERVDLDLNYRLLGIYGEEIEDLAGYTFSNNSLLHALSFGIRLKF